MKSKANLDLKNQEKISQLLFSLPQTLVEVIHHYSEEDLKRYDKVNKTGEIGGGIGFRKEWQVLSFFVGWIIKNSV